MAKRQASTIILYALVANSTGHSITQSASPVIKPSDIESQQDAMKCTQLAERTLRKICTNPQDVTTNPKKTLATKLYAFHYQTHDGLIFMAISHRDYGQNLAFSFLEDVIKAWDKRFKGKIVDLTTQDFQEVDSQFQPVLKKKLALYGDEGTKVLVETKEKLQSAKGAALKAVDKVTKRHEELSSLTAKAQALDDEGYSFAAASKQAKVTACWTYYKTQIYLVAIIVTVMAVIIYLIGYTVCGGLTWPDCGDHGGHKPNEDHHHN
jgi:hypothetical protein